MLHKNAYHTDLIIAYQTNALEADFLKMIPSSTLFNWKKRNMSNIIGADNAGFNKDNMFMVKTFLKKKKALKLAKAAYFVYKVYEKIAAGSEAFANELKGIKEKVVKVIDHVRPVTGLRRALKAFHLSEHQYYRWKTGIVCSLSSLNLCFKRKPNQLMQKEVNLIKKYLNMPDLLHWPLASVYYKMMREQAAFMSLNTWYKYANILIKNRLVVFRKKLRKTRYQGLKAERLFQYIHIDVTIFRPLDNTKLYLYFIQDNFSKTILSWRASTTYKASICKENLQEAIEKFKLYNFQAQVICDGGPENQGEAAQYLESIPIERLIAQKDILFSNSLIEAFNKRIKYRFLFTQNLENIEQTITYLHKAIPEYNNQPVLVLNGYTPNEVLSGANPSKNLFTKDIEASVRQRIAENRNTRCGDC